jgi:hypothetical protein
MEKITHQFGAEGLGSASVSKDGMEILLEFESEGERLWVTFPSSAIERLKTLVQDAHTMAVDASHLPWKNFPKLWLEITRPSRSSRFKQQSNLQD